MNKIMGTLKTYLVPVDFSRTSGRALSYAIKLASESPGELLLVHVVTDSPAYVPINLRADYYANLTKKAHGKIKNMMRRRGRETGLAGLYNQVIHVL
jgi:nucleotide-binding universal stress UspA family protein